MSSIIVVYSRVRLLLPSLCSACKVGISESEFEPCRKASVHEVRELLILIAADRMPVAVRETHPFGSALLLGFGLTEPLSVTQTQKHKMCLATRIRLLYNVAAQTG
jgi:hypothetical protein